MSSHPTPQSPKERLNALNRHLQSTSQQVDRLAPNLDLSTALLARFPWGANESLIRRETIARLAQARTVLDRDITDRECTTSLKYVRHKVNAQGQTSWLSFFAAAYFWNRGKKTYRFPFYTPKTPPLGGGPFAHTLRIAAYAMVCSYAFSPVEVGAGLWAASQALDEADVKVLERLNKDVSAGAAAMRGGTQSMRQSMPVDTGAQQQQRQQQGTYTTRWPSDESTQYSSQQQDSSAPYTTRWPEDASTQYTPEPTQTSYSTNYQNSTPNAQDDSTSYQSSTPPTQTRSSNWDSPSSFDDASPLAPEEPQTSSQPANSWARVRQQARQSQSNTSSWASVRQASANAEGQSGWTSQDDGNRGQARDSYTFSAADAERDSAKTQAQREFDAMLERERRGDGGSEGGSGGWRR